MGNGLLTKNEYIALELTKAYLYNGTKVLPPSAIVGLYERVRTEVAVQEEAIGGDGEC